MGGRTLLIMLAAIIILSPCAHALALGYDHLENKTLPLAPGETYYFKLILQNDETEDLIVNVSMQSSIATLVGGEHLTLPARTFDRFVYFNISVPENATPGARYPVRFHVTPVQRGEGQVPFSVNYDRTFDVLVTAKPGVIVTPTAPTDIGKVERERMPAAVVLIIAVAMAAVVLAVALIWRRSRGVSRTLRKAPVSRTDPQHAFIARNGAKYHDVAELLDGLRSMSESDFHHHVNEHKDDFSVWVESALCERKTAKRLRAAQTRQKMIKVLEHELR